MKRIMAILLTLAMLLGCCAVAEPAEAVEATGTETYEIETKNFPVYVPNTAEAYTEIPLYFVDGVDDVPFMEIHDWVKFLDNSDDDEYQLTVSVNDEGNLVTLVRENDYNMALDFDNGTIYFWDYLAFLQLPGKDYLDVSSIPETDADGQPFLMSRTASRKLYGKDTLIDLSKYAIPMIAQDGLYLIPMQTLSALTLTPSTYSALYFNGEAVFFNGISNMVPFYTTFIRAIDSFGLVTDDLEAQINAYDGPMNEYLSFLFDLIRNNCEDGAEIVEAFEEAASQDIYTRYTSVPSKPRSEALRYYSYNELCMELDCFYGLKDAHNIESFDAFFMQTGLAKDLIDPDAEKADRAISDLLTYWFDDGHSVFISSSCMSDSDPEKQFGFSRLADFNLSDTIQDIRAAYPKSTEPYYEVGDTAYVTFDSFTTASGIVGGFADYYALAEQGELGEDTIGLIIQAHQLITREDSPIKNVVLDLSANGGGEADAALFVLGWFLGDANYSFVDTFTGAQSTSSVRADVNLDHVFDEQDTLAGRGLNLYCLTSSSSFSCGNLLPWAFRESGTVTLLGKTTGGGSCVVGFATSPWGSSYRYSSPSRISFVKNGAYYDVDQGVVPDHVIDDYEHFYDRIALTDFIHGLY